MSIHNLGGSWTEKKLNCVKGYSESWAKIMKSIKDKGYIKSFVYIDAFSGTGNYTHNQSKPTEMDDLFDTEIEKTELRKGSATNALEISPKFDRIHLIESKKEYASQLRKTAGEELNTRVFVHEQDANEALLELCDSLSSKERALIFIDPYGCEVHWSTLEKIANSKVADVWYLAPTSGVNRQLSGLPGKIEPYKRDRLNKVLGTKDWEDHFYTPETEPDLFGHIPSPQRNAGPIPVEEYFVNRLEGIFAYAHEECLRLNNSRSGHMFSLCFAISNESKPAQDAARKIAGHLIKKWS